MLAALKGLFTSTESAPSEPPALRFQKRTALAVVLLVGLFHILTIRSGHDWADDFAQYVAHARNLAEGRPYGETGYIFNPSNQGVGPATYPPVFPLMLAPVWMVFGFSLVAMKVESILFFLFFLWLFWFTLRAEIRVRYRLTLLFLVGINPLFWNLKDRVTSDIPFLMWTYATLV